MSVNLSPLGGVAAQFFNNDGVPLAGGLINTYAAGTNTPAATYTTGAGTIAHSNPIVLDSAGRIPTGEIWLTDGVAYKFVIKDSTGALIGTYDNIVGINSNFVNYTSSQEIQTATAGQTVFTLTTMQYQPGSNSLTVFVDGVNQYGPGASYAFTETSSTSVTFVSGLHVGASVKFTTAVINNIGGVDASQVTYEAPFTNSETTNVEAKLSEYLSVTDFIPPGTNTASVNCTTYFANAKAAALADGKALWIPAGTYLTSIAIASGESDLRIVGENRQTTILEAIDSSTATISIHWAAFRVQIESLSIQNTAGSNNGTHYGIWSRGSGSNNGASGLKITDCVVSNYNINIRLDEFNDMSVAECVLSGAVAGGASAPIGANFYAGSPTYPCVGLDVYDLYCISGKYGMYLENTEGIKMSFLDCVLSTAQGLIHQRTTGNTIGMVISDSYFDSTTLDAFYLEGVDYGMFNNIWTSASTVAGTGNGVQLVNCSNNMFTNLTAYGCKAAGLLLLQDCTSNTFNACTFNNNATYGVNIANSNNNFNVFNGCFTSANTTGALNFLDTTAGSPNWWLNSITSGAITVQTKDIKQGGNASGGKTFSLTYQKQNLPDGAASSNLDFTTGQTVFIAPVAGALIAISVALTDTRTAGTLAIRPLINGVADDDLRVLINATNTQYVYGNASIGDVPVVAAGDRIQIFYDTDASWDTTGGAGTVDITATVVFIST
jgi:hypothetical protein